MSSSTSVACSAALLHLLVVFLGLRDALFGELAECGGTSNFGISNLGISNFGISNFGISKAGALTATGFGLDFVAVEAAVSAMTIILWLAEGVFPHGRHPRQIRPASL